MPGLVRTVHEGQPGWLWVGPGIHYGSVYLSTNGQPRRTLQPKNVGSETQLGRPPSGFRRLNALAKKGIDRVITEVQAEIPRILGPTRKGGAEVPIGSPVWASLMRHAEDWNRKNLWLALRTVTFTVPSRPG